MEKIVLLIVSLYFVGCTTNKELNSFKKAEKFFEEKHKSENLFLYQNISPK